MKLSEWRARNGMSQAAFARALSERSRRAYAQTTVAGWERGTLPRRTALGDIHGFTGGEVTANDFMAIRD